MALSNAEKERVRYHLGYMSTNMSSSLSLGVPSVSQLQFILERQMVSLLVDAEPGVRRAIQELDCIEDQQSSFRRSLEVLSTGDVKIRGADAFAELDIQYSRWCQRLADTLGSTINPFSLQHQTLNTMGPSVVIEQG